MKLMVHELKAAGLTQSFTVDGRNAEIYALRPHLYKHGSPAGSFWLEIQDAQGQTVATSESLTAAQISSASYFHGYVRFLISAPLQANRAFQVTLKSTGYTFSEAGYIGWCNDFDLRTLPEGYSETSVGQAPLDCQFWIVGHDQRGA